VLLHRWIRLDKKDSDKVLSEVDKYIDSAIFSKDMTEVTFRTLPFYTNYKLYMLSNYATMPVFTMLFLSDGNKFIQLNGLSNPIYEANSLDPIHLTEKNLISYLKFFFRYVQGSEGEVFLITDIKKFPHLDILQANKRDEIIKTYEPVEIKLLNSTEIEYSVKALILYGDAIIKTYINLKENGNILFTQQEIITSGINLPGSMYKDHEII